MHYSYMVIDHTAGSRSSASARAPLPGSPTAQKFLPTEFDWRVGVRAATGRSSRTAPTAPSREGGFPPFELAKAPGALIDIAVRAARPIGQGFYDVDVKETDRGFIVMEVNDNPNLEHGIEDQAGKDEIWIRVLKWFIERFEQ